MSNYIKINVTDPGDDLPLKVQDGLTPIDDSTVTFVSAGTSTDLTIAGAVQGTGAAGEVVIGGTSQQTMTVALNITSGGQNYKIGDTVSVTSTGGANFTGSVTFEVTEAMLVDVTAAEKLIDVDNVIGVSCPATTADTVEIFTNLYDGTSANLTYTCQFDLDQDTINDIAINISEAYRKAVQAENSQPVVDLGDAVCIGVTFD